MYMKKPVVAPKYPEVGSVDAKALKKVCKNLTDAEVAEYAALYNLVVKDYGHDSINRMRQIMAITGLHFPSTIKAAKPKSVYAHLTLENLLGQIVDGGVFVEVTDDERIMRMRAIMALRAAGKLVL
jgi:hypothetical protein